MEGHPYTWEKSRGTTRWVEERLDRVFVNEDWRFLFPTNKVQNLIAPTSDHSSLFLQVSVWRPRTRGYRFRFENCWLREEGCSDIVMESWKKIENVDIRRRIEMCGTELKKWGDKLVQDFKHRLRKCRDTMDRFCGLRDQFSIQCFREAEAEYSKILGQQEIFWKQRAKQHWLQGGDCNTKYFHTYASSRRKKNQILHLKNSEGDWVNWSTGLGDLMENYYSKLFKSTAVREEGVLDCIEERLNSSHNAELTQEFTEEEVKQAVFAMHPDKSSGPDGMNPSFYQIFWSIIGNDVAKECCRILEVGEVPDNLNDSLVVFIPKKKRPEMMGDLRPISLCNVMMKIVSKMLANRLKGLLPNIISETQSAFVSGRLITDNAIVALEINHWMHRKTKGKIGYTALKIDMSKAYDRVE